MTSEEGADWRRIFFDNVYRHHRTLYGREAPKEPNQDQLQEFCEGVRTLAKQYVDDPDLHDPAMTHFLLLDVLQSQQQILLWTAQWASITRSRSGDHFHPLTGTLCLHFWGS